MIDVHPPHGSVHSWRDFFIHIATITIGLLIAISLEGMVEAAHHWHIVREARENIRREIEQNEKQAKENIEYVQSDAARMKQNMEWARDLRADSHAMDHKKLQFTFTWSSFSDSAWTSARDSGALTYMPTSEVQSYADGYKQQEFINQQAIAVFSYQTELAAPSLIEKDSALLRAEDVQSLVHGCAVASIRLTVLQQLIEELNKNYEDALHR